MIPYSDFTFFGILFLFLIPAIVLGFLGKGIRGYAFFMHFVFIWLIFGNNSQELYSLVIYVLYQWMVLCLYFKYKDQNWTYPIALLFSLLPLVLVKITPVLSPHSTLGFLGVSYLTFKNVQIIIEAKDQLIKDITPYEFFDFLLFFPTISSGPIDRYRRYGKDAQIEWTDKQYGEFLFQGIHRLFQGFLYKYILAYLINRYWLPLKFLQDRPVAAFVYHSYQQFFHYFFTLAQFKTFVSAVLYMYGYSLYLFFDFAGYTAFAVGVSYILGIKTPENFNRPFISRNIKEFWNRWNMTLSFWFRDYVFMRVVFALTRKKVLKSRQIISYIGYLSLFGLMGFWHGLAWHYIVYGLYHAALFIGYDLFDRFNKKCNIWKNNVYFRGLSVVITFHFVCFGFLIFSGYLF
ncbi:D-alanyl-lipoteichoic acid biosynthesis protein DltB [Fodinisporobacter ferrooxydans]|uniref:Teichoic acid D-alanyltransferase n=1 Tax=Fodinisporobacter ferrooxydans TaxID=2901836 RepID=A0ABY4CHC2_9BACL|nr:D-alanyl-lipoteichoic acid biosynthesis protein DltB [Alicyclobacillaceae bacterium MYW30-H2]